MYRWEDYVVFGSPGYLSGEGRGGGGLATGLNIKLKCTVSVIGWMRNTENRFVFYLKKKYRVIHIV